MPWTWLRGCRAAWRPPVQPLDRARGRRRCAWRSGRCRCCDWPRLTWSLGWTGFLEPRSPPASSMARLDDDLVGVHVALRARAGLEDDERELGVELARDDLVGRTHDEVGDVGGQLAELAVRLRRTLLEDAEGTDHRAPPHERVTPDGEVLDAALCLRAPVAVGGDLDGAHRVRFGPVCRCVRHVSTVGATMAR